MRRLLSCALIAATARCQVLKHSWGRADSDWEGQGPMGNIGLLSGSPQSRSELLRISPRGISH